MKLSLRWHIVLTLAPLLLLLIVLGGAGAILLLRLGGRIDAILRENYRSVIYMERLNEALERIDSSFHIALAGREQDARSQFREQWLLFDVNLNGERNNSTFAGEGGVVGPLPALDKEYRSRGKPFSDRPSVVNAIR